MELRILYFGMIAEATNRTEEIISLPSGKNVNYLENLLRNKYKNLQSLSFKIAVDQKFSSDDTLLSTQNEIALLPPFSGG